MLTSEKAVFSAQKAQTGKSITSDFFSADCGEEDFIDLYFVGNKDRATITINGNSYRTLIKHYFAANLHSLVVNNVKFEQNGALCNTHLMLQFINCA